MTMKHLHSSLAVAVLVALLGTLGGCASSGGGEAKAAKADVAIPSSSPLAKIELGMNDAQVRNAIGNPDNSKSYMTGKAWIPFYYGSDTHRSDWIYSGVGRVVFSRNRWSGGLKVVKLIHNPSEP